MRKSTYQTKFTDKTVIIKKCHMCGHINEGRREMENCKKCNKGFLPLNYFKKIHAKTSEAYKELFAHSDELHDEEVIKGLYVLW